MRAPATASIVLAATLAWTGGCNRSRVSSHYDDPEAMIDVFEDEARDEWQMPDRVVRALPIANKDAVIAEIGAGSGYFTRRLASQVPGGKVYAVDVDATFEEHLEENREAWGLPNIEPHLAHYEDPMLPAASIDLVFASNTMAFLRDRTAYFRHVHKALRPGGMVALVDFHPDATPPEKAAPPREQRVPRDRLVSEVTAAGFTLDREERFLPHQYFLIFKRGEAAP